MIDAIISYKRDVESKDDHDLAVAELASIAGQDPVEVAHAEARKRLRVKKLPFVAQEQRVYAVKVTPQSAERLVRRLAFWDLLLVAESDFGVEPERVAAGNAWSAKGGVVAFATQSQVMEWTAYGKDDPALCAALRAGHSLERLLEASEHHVRAAVSAPLTPISRRKNEYLTHGFHKYKAKFFPRLARSLINCTCPGDDAMVLDPYCGSGTTGVEASLMGLEAAEFDLDPLSAFIAHSKALLGHLDLAKFRRAVAELPAKFSQDSQLALMVPERYRLPKFLLERNPRRLTPDVLEEIEAEATAIQELVRGLADEDTRDLFELALSHAMATKVSLRWMGTGDNRFALEIGHRSLYAVFIAQLKYMLRKLDSWAALREGGVVQKYGNVRVAVSDCTALPLPDACLDGVVTSPPYLPAASGRETYLRSRAASLVALGLMTEASIHDTEARIVGSILAEPHEQRPLPPSVADLVSWMLPQRERKAKARPTAAYFERLGDSLAEMKRVLKPGGLIALVVSKEHMFYEMTTRAVLRRFDMVQAISELATEDAYGIGLELDRVQVLELPKMDFAARPGSHGTYSEAILFFRKKAGSLPQKGSKSRKPKQVDNAAAQAT